MNGFSLAGRRALVTGAARGIGRAIALAFCAAGAEVLAHDRDADPLADLAKAGAGLGKGSGAILPLVADLGIPGQPEALVAAALAGGPVDILVLSASVQVRESWKDVGRRAFDTQVAINLDATRLLLAGLAPGMVANGWGRILGIGSVQEVKGRPDMLVYAALKSAQTTMLLTLARELAPSGVTCNVLAPGAIATDRNADVLADPDYRARATAAIPAGRIGRPEDCTGPALLLCSEAGGYITGQRLLVDGGMHL